MKQLLTQAVKTGATYFLCGGVFALAAPYLGALLGIAPDVTSASAELGLMGDPVLVGAAAASIGVIDVLMKPLFKKMFGEAKSAPEPEKPLQ